MFSQVRKTIAIQLFQNIPYIEKMRRFMIANHDIPKEILGFGSLGAIRLSLSWVLLAQPDAHS
jgi:hypothetical protein